MTDTPVGPYTRFTDYVAHHLVSVGATDEPDRLLAESAIEAVRRAQGQKIATAAVRARLYREDPPRGLIPRQWTVYRGCWELLKHCLKGRGSEDLTLAISWDTPDGEDAIHGRIRDFWWESRADGFTYFEGFAEEPPQPSIYDTHGPQWKAP